MQQRIVPAAESNKSRKEKKMISKLFKMSIFVAAAVFFIGTGDCVQAADNWSVIGERTIKDVD